MARSRSAKSRSKAACSASSAASAPTHRVTKLECPPIRTGNSAFVFHVTFKCSRCELTDVRLYQATKDEATMFSRVIGCDGRSARDHPGRSSTFAASSAVSARPIIRFGICFAVLALSGCASTNARETKVPRRGRVECPGDRQGVTLTPSCALYLLSRDANREVFCEKDKVTGIHDHRFCFLGAPRRGECLHRNDWIAASGGEWWSDHYGSHR